jgi:SAM-dependent methyltransferase
VRPVNYDERLYAVYAQGRALSPESLGRWLAAFESWAPARRPLQVLDLGCGVGRFTPGLADTFGGPVFGVEPSERMRVQALQNAAHPAVSYLAGAAEAIPLPDGSCDLALLYFVLHHVAEKQAAAAELARVLRRGGRLFVRTNFSDRMPELEWYRFCPRARDVDRSMYEPLSVVEDRFSAAGFCRVGLEEVEFEEARDRRELLARLRLRALSTFEHLSDEEAERGFAAMNADITTHGKGGPLTAMATVLVLEC